MRDWQDGFGPAPGHPALELDAGRVEALLDELTGRLRDNYPFFHPRYAGQMLKPPHPAAIAGHLAAMLVNPNNHALDGGPATAALEREAVAMLAAMLHLPGDTLGHLTGGGTVANLEALFVARELHPGRGVACSEQAHYTHARMCHLLGMACEPVATDAAGRIDVSALEALLRSGRCGTVVVTAGTTGLGAVDPVDLVLPLAREHGVRVHVDAAYGGLFAILAWAGDGDAVPAAPLRAIAGCDSVVVDPHKHGLQPYGCGAVLFRDPSVARLYAHDSPYTYYTAAGGHLGEISLECSRAGAAAAALWLTLQAFPLTPAGLGAVLAAGLRAARRWWELLGDSELLAPVLRPELDIVTLVPRAPRSLSALDAACQEMLQRGMTEPDPVYLSVLRLDATRLGALLPEVDANAASARVLRSVLMKPAHELWVERLHRRVEALATPSGASG
jgi:glutamate/tyrosine decarboxylase-like PLP-dependent enzyme